MAGALVTWKWLCRAGRPLRAVSAVAVLAWACPAEASLRHDLRAALQTSRRTLERCYDRELKRDEPATGTVVISMVVNRSGRISKAKVAQANPKQATVGNCLAGKLGRMRLPAQRSRVAVLLPIKLKVRRT